jgi:hypothetical protein
LPNAALAATPRQAEFAVWRGTGAGNSGCENFVGSRREVMLQFDLASRAEPMSNEERTGTEAMGKPEGFSPMARRFLAALAVTALLCGHAFAAKPRVELEVFSDPGLQATTAAQRWTKTLGDAGFDAVRFRPLRNGDRPNVQTQTIGSSTVVNVTAQLTSRGALVTSAGQFTASDSAKLQKWLAELQAGGGLPGERKSVFGLTGKQFVDLKAALAKPINFATKGERPEKVWSQIKAGLSIPLVIDRQVEKEMLADEPVRDELQGLATGTALAAVVRTAGGVLVPRPAGKQIEIVATEPQRGVDAWPIGWPPEEKNPQKVLPVLFEFINVEIPGVPAAEAIAAIQPRVQAPFLFDYNNMVSQRVDLKKLVKVPAGKSYYNRILDRVLYQAGLKFEVRSDDAGKPFIWITTL